LALTENSHTLFTGKPTIRLDTLPSTNRYATDLLSKTTPSEGTCIVTDFQTDGQGQIGRYWFSDRLRNITASYIFYPNFLIATSQFELSIMAALAVRRVLDMAGIPDATIKWPNDIYVGDLKAGGILIQNQLQGSFIKNTIIGIGINVNQNTFPTQIPNPTSMSLQCGRVFDLSAVLQLLHSETERHYLRLKAGKIQALRSEYLSHLYRKDQWQCYRTPDGPVFLAKIRDVAHDGALIMEDTDGKERRFSFRELIFKFS
jgi:BirA family transcriptional regulator, biotin operon repressor / biotin---[acetyl-CoA-carboxylase] ligase